MNLQSNLNLKLFSNDEIAHKLYSKLRTLINKASELVYEQYMDIFQISGG